MKNTSFNILLFMCLSMSLLGQDQILFDFEDYAEIEDFFWLHEEEDWPSMVKDFTVKDGNLIITPWTSGWYADYMAPFLFLNISGDFVAESRVLVRGFESSKPKAEWSLGGLMVREPLGLISSDWSPGNQNWLFLTTGFADDIEQPVFETKTTIDSNSFLRLHPNKLDWVSLRIERNHSVFTLSYKYDEQEEWVQIEELLRPDFPRELQVGLIAYTDFYSAERMLMKDVRKYNSTVVEYGSPDLNFFVSYLRIYQ